MLFNPDLDFDAKALFIGFLMGVFIAVSVCLLVERLAHERQLRRVLRALRAKGYEAAASIVQRMM